LLGKLDCGLCRFGDAADARIRDNALDGQAVGMSQVLCQQFGDALRQGHGLTFQRFADAVHAAVDGGADADLGHVADQSILACCNGHRSPPTGFGIVFGGVRLSRVRSTDASI
jgi:hypothetical protein